MRKKEREEEREKGGVKERERPLVAGSGLSRPLGLCPPLREENRKIDIERRGGKEVDKGKGGGEAIRELPRLLDGRN